jgi:heptosyltransferase-2
MAAAPDSERLERILVRGVNWLGDAVMTTPALQRLREAQPRAHIALLTRAKLADLWRHHPDVDQVLTFAKGEGAWSVARHLRSLDFTVALVLPNSPRSAIEVWLAGIPRRVGHARPWRNIFLTERVAPDPNAVKMHKRSLAEIRRLISSQNPLPTRPISPAAHHLHQYLNLVAALGGNREPVAPRIAVAPAEVETVRKRFEFPLSEKERPILLGINPGAEYGAAKRWPSERFAAAAVEMQKRTRCIVWVFGGSAEAALAASVAEEIRSARAAPAGSVRSVAGLTSLRELCAGLKACDVVLTNDTGPMHVAAAVGTPVVVPFGSTSPELTGPCFPVGTRHRLLRKAVPCSPCFRRECPIDFRCMTGISVEAVVEAALKALREGAEAAVI